MDADTYQQVAVPAAARLTEKENSEVLPYHNQPATTTIAGPPPPYAPSKDSGAQSVNNSHEKHIKPAVRSGRGPRDRRKGLLCIGVATTLLVIIPSIIFGIIMFQVNHSDAYVQKEACTSKHSGFSESVVDGSSRCD